MSKMLFCLLVVLWAGSEALTSTILRVNNLAGAPVDVWWVNPNPSHPGDRLKQILPPMRNGSEVQINTFHTHQFLIRFVQHRNGVESLFTKGLKEEVVSVYFDDFLGNFTVRHQHELPPQNFDSIQDALQACDQNDVAGFSRCVARGAMADMKRIADSQLRLNKYRDAISLRLRNYTCSDEEMDTTQPIETYEFLWSSLNGKGERTYEVKTLLDMDAAKIWAVENFMTPEECAILETVGRPKFHRATVAAEDGTSTVSEHRKAQQASYDHHQQNMEQDPLWDLQQRILALTNYHSNFSLAIDGQEGFTIIQYNPEDQYFPHCDGACEGQTHVPTGRVATAVMYCKVPERGGATTFTKADIFVRPKPLAATFFSYKGPGNKMDTGFTEHSGCPVVQGEKIITTFWMREGVTFEENWTKYDPSGLKILTD